MYREMSRLCKTENMKVLLRESKLSIFFVMLFWLEH